MDKNFLLSGKGAVALYETVKDLPIIDYHNHIPISDVICNKKYESLYELWLQCDPYKHRLMRICGVPEMYITGDASPFEKIEKFFEIFPYLVGNPVFDWAKMELSAVFGINELPGKDNAKYIFDKCSEMLSSDEFSTRGILTKFNVEYQSPVACLTDDISVYDGISYAPSLRADDLLDPNESFRSDLSKLTGIKICDEDSFMKAVCKRLDEFKDRGCHFADHALDSEFFKGGPLAKERLAKLGKEYSKRNMTLLLHMDAERSTSERLSKIAGKAGGYAAVGGALDYGALIGILNVMEGLGGLPDTVLFPLNINDQAPLAVLQGSFSEDGVSSKVQLGPAWWWCDHALGIENTLDAIASFGVFSKFIGMTTDSRSVLSFVRHDYFRRIFCSWLNKKSEACEFGIPFEMLSEISRNVCYYNAKNKIER